MLRFISLMVGEGEEMNFKDCFSGITHRKNKVSGRIAGNQVVPLCNTHDHYSPNPYPT